MSVRTRRAKSFGQNRSPVPGPQYLRKRHQRRENRLRLAALRQLSAQQVRERASMAIAPRVDGNQTTVWLLRATTILLSATISMLIVGVARSFSNSGADILYHLGLGVAAMALILLCLTWTSNAPGVTRTPFVGGKLVSSLADGLRKHLGSLDDTEEGQLRGVFSIYAFGGGVALALMPFILRMAVATDRWLDDAFIWYSFTHTIRLLLLSVFVLILPLIFLWYGLYAARVAIRRFEGEVTTLPLLFLFGGLLGLAAAEFVRNAVRSPATLLIAAAVPCFLIPILWLRGAAEAERTAHAVSD